VPTRGALRDIRAKGAVNHDVIIDSQRDETCRRAKYGRGTPSVPDPTLMDVLEKVLIAQRREDAKVSRSGRAWPCHHNHLL
jgi:hypothetical protein